MSKKKTEPAAAAKDNVVALTIKNRAELEGAIAQMGDLQRQKRDIENRYGEQIQALQEQLGEELQPIDAAILAVSLGIKAFADLNRKEIFPTEKKTVAFPTGSISYRDKPAAVKTRQSAKLVEKILAENGLLDYYHKAVTKFNKVFLRLKLEINKDAVLADPITARKLIGVEIEEGVERLYVKPSAVDTELEVAC
jgi:phage host-nuclease inhibitor protein Gam